MANPLIKLFRTKIYMAVTLLLMLLAIGVLGFRIMSNYSWIDAIYMTVITITTVGFGEVQPLDDFAKIFTIFLILASVIIVGYALTVITEYILSKNDPLLFFIQRLRDEAHRFAISTHRAKRKKNLSKSLLDQIQGIGKQRKRALLNHFGSARAVESASLDDLKSIEGIEDKRAFV